MLLKLLKTSSKWFLYLNIIVLFEGNNLGLSKPSNKVKFLIGAREVMIVPIKRWAFSKAVEEGVYTCPTTYGAGDVEYIAFYRVSPISAITHIARVSKIRDKIPFNEIYGEVYGPEGEQIKKYGKIVKVYYLDKVEKLPRPIVKGKAAPIQRFRYAILDEIMKAKSLEDLRKKRLVRRITHCMKCGRELPEGEAESELSMDRVSFIKQIYSNVSVIANSPPTECDGCFERYRFSRLEDFFKKTCLPPIGDFEAGQVLFIGTNPRCHPGTEDELFYRYALSSLDNFLQFSINGMYKDSTGNMRFLFDDQHYSIHQECLAMVDTSWRLGDRSSVAELFMCGSEDTGVFKGLRYNLDDYVCAQKYLIKYMELVKPKIIVSFGQPTMQCFQARFALPRDNITNLHAHFFKITLNSGHTSTLIISKHPNARDFKRVKEKLLRAFTYMWLKIANEKS